MVRVRVMSLSLFYVIFAILLDMDIFAVILQ